MAQQLLNLGAAPNDGNGTDLRTGGQIINDNFTELYTEKQTIIANIKFINTRFDLPAAVGGVITLIANTTYYFINHIDLQGDRIVCQSNVSILGASSENCSLTSTNINVSFPSNYLIESDYTLPIRHITIKDVPKAISINATNIGAQPIALDWTGVNFSGCTTNLFCGDIDNFIFSKGAVLGNGGVMTFNGTTGTLGIDNSLFVGGAGKLIELTSSAVITRRFRVIYSSFVAFGTCTAIDTTGSTIPTDSYILDTCNFSGGATYLAGYGLVPSDNEPRFVNNKGIINTSAVGNYSMNNNATATVITTQGVAVKVLGTTIANSINQKFNHSDNRLTYIGELVKNFQINTVATVTSNSSNKQIGFYVAKNGVVLTDSEMYITTDNNFKAESVAIQTITTLQNNDYIEIFVENDTDTSNLTITFLNTIVKEL